MNEGFESINQADVDRVLSYVPAAVVRQLQGENIVLAGGCLRDTVAGLPIKDLDIFCHSEEQACRLAHEVGGTVRHTTFAYTVDLGIGIPVQYVFYKEFADANDLVSQFDFRACCAGLWWGSPLFGWLTVAVPGFSEDCRGKTLRFMSQKKDDGKLSAMRRALDFARRGWSISNAEVAAIILHWEGVKPTANPLEYADRHVSVVRAFRPCYGRV